MRSKWDNVIFEGGASGKYMVDLENPFKNSWGYVLMLCNAGNGLLIENNSTSTHFGNNEIESLSISVTGGDALNISSINDNKNMNLNVIKHFQAFQNGAAGTSIGLSLGRGAKYNSLLFIDVEGFNQAIYGDGDAGSYAAHNYIGGGYADGKSDTGPIHWDEHTGQNKVENLYFDSTTAYAWQDNGEFNIWQDTQWESALTPSTHTNSFCYGSAGNNKYYENAGSANNATTTTIAITHALIGTPTVVLCSFNSTAITGYSWTSTSTTITVTIAGTLPATTTCYWKAIYKQ